MTREPLPYDPTITRSKISDWWWLHINGNWFSASVYENGIISVIGGTWTTKDLIARYPVIWCAPAILPEIPEVTGPLMEFPATTSNRPYIAPELKTIDRGISTLTSPCSPPAPAPDGWIYAGFGAIKFRPDKDEYSPDIAMFEHGKWQTSFASIGHGNNYYIVRQGSEIAKLNGLGIAPPITIFIP